MGLQCRRHLDPLASEMKLYDSSSAEASRMPEASMKYNTGIKQASPSLIF